MTSFHSIKVKECFLKIFSEMEQVVARDCIVSPLSKLLSYNRALKKALFMVYVYFYSKISFFYSDPPCLATKLKWKSQIW
jgi:hypothetical protein